jgi:NAD-dependent dihydropyrimidine dehydrogenase PreA subunit
VRRKIIEIDEELCTGCGLCLPECPEGALQIIDGKARLVSDLFCDGLGACVGFCPEGAMTVVEREAGEYDERTVMANIARQGANTIAAHLEHLRDHGETELYAEALDYLREEGIDIPAHGTEPDPIPCGCPGSLSREIERPAEDEPAAGPALPGVSRLTHWPVQIMLLPPRAPYFKDADLLLTADCVPFAYPTFHEDLLKDKVLLVGCPKLDDAGFYREKMTAIVSDNEIRSITIVHMEVPCCFGLPALAKEAVQASGRRIPFHDITITVDGTIRETVSV